MRFIPHAPAPALAPFVDYLWWSDSPDGVPVEGAQLPEAGVTVMFNFGAPQGVREGRRIDWYRSRWASGERLRPFHLVAPRGARLLGVHFRPGGAAPFFGVPMRELADRVIDLDLLWPDAGSLHERLAAASGVDPRFGLLERELIERLHRAAVPRRQPVHASMQWLAAGPPGLRVRDLAAALGLGERQLLRRFDDEVGIGPKALHRLLRFRSVIGALDSDPTPEWPALALDCGYFDQAHLIRDFRGFTGLTPTAYLAQRSVDPHFAGSASA